MEGAVQAVKPARFGRYVLLDRIGAGGMAEVFRAVMPGAGGFKRTFVVKRILGQLSQSASFIDMFVREARIGALLNHPNIVQVYDFGNVDGEYFLAMEYVRGRDVLAVMRRLRDMKRPFPVAVATFIAHEVATSLAYAHELAGPDGLPLGIIHRDVSPSNIMCLRTGGVKLLDFGIARAAGDAVLESEDSSSGSFKGKLGYLPPERVRNEPFDHRSDLYALGVVLWEMLACRRLFRGSNEVETLNNVLEMPVAPPSSVNPTVPATLDAIVMRALARDPAQRYASGQEMVDDLEAVLSETKFHSRMVGKLLVDLFGSGLQSSQIALSSLTPELLALAGATEVSAPGSSLAGAADALASQDEVPDTRPGKPWRLWAGIGAAALVTAVVAALAIRWVAAEAPQPAQAPNSGAPTQPRIARMPAIGNAASAPIDPPLPGADNVVPLPVGATQDPPRAAAATARPAPPAPAVVPARRSLGAKKRGAARPQSDESRIANGLSIDPFAEVAKRGRR